jgi:hypothetical protein
VDRRPSSAAHTPPPRHRPATTSRGWPPVTFGHGNGLVVLRNRPVHAVGALQARDRPWLLALSSDQVPAKLGGGTALAASTASENAINKVLIKPNFLITKSSVCLLLRCVVIATLIARRVKVKCLRRLATVIPRSFVRFRDRSCRD